MAVKCVMPGWLVNLMLATVVAVLLLVAGSSQLIMVFALMFAWFFLLGLLGLLGETLAQLARGRWRRYRRGP